MTWTRFMDMHSGGGCKIPGGEYIYIEADSEEAARRLLMTRFGRDADNVTCDCCGADYSVDTCDTLEEATAFERRCIWLKESKSYDISTGEPLAEYLKSPGVMVIRANQVQP